MKELSAWILSIAGVVLLGVLVDLIVPEGRTQKYIKGIFGIITVFVIVAPLPALIRKDWSSEFGSIGTGGSGGGSVIDDQYLYGEYKRKAEVMERSLVLHLADNGYRNAAVSITVTSYTESMAILYVYVDIYNLVIDADKQHINKYSAIRRLAADYLKVDEQKVILYG